MRATRAGTGAKPLEALIHAPPIAVGEHQGERILDALPPHRAAVGRRPGPHASLAMRPASFSCPCHREPASRASFSARGRHRTCTSTVMPERPDSAGARSRFVTLGPLVAAVVQVIRDPPPQHAELVLFGILGAAFDRLVWSVGIAVAVLLVRAVVAAIHLRRGGRSVETPGEGGVQG
jgi:hypothetical protein